MRDKLGKEIKPGKYIAYAAEVLDCKELKIAGVIKVDDIKNTCSVMSVLENWNGKKLSERTVTIRSPKKIIVLEPDNIPFEYSQLLDVWVR